MKSQPQHRRGISLIEILVVVSIIGTLTAISVGVVFRLQASQNVNNSEGTLSKLHSNMQTRWSAVLDDAKKNVPQGLIDGVAEGDKDRARAIWSYAKVQNEFPESFAEANRTINLGTGAVLTPRRVFTAVATANSGATLEEQSALLISAALMQTGNAGNAMGEDGLQNQMSPLSATLKGNVFRDAWGVPIVFKRHATNTEINAEPFLRATRFGTMTIFNPFDPLAKLIPHTVSAENPWAIGGSPSNRQTVVTQLGYTPNTYRFENVNVLPTLVSAGANKKLGTMSTMLNGADDDTQDNLFSYRTRREGDKGN